MLLVMLFLSHSEGISEIPLLNLQEAYSLSVLIYASPALILHSTQISELNARWNNVIRRTLDISESVKAVIYDLGRLNVAFEFLVRKVNIFYKCLYFKPVLLFMIFSGQFYCRITETVV